MYQLYTSQATANLESIVYINICLEDLNTLKKSPLLALHAKPDTFGVSLYPDSDAILKELILMSWKRKNCILY